MLLSITEIRVLLKYQVLEEKKPTSWARQKCHDFYPPWNFKKGIHGTASIVGQLKLQANEQGILKTVSNCWPGIFLREAIKRTLCFFFDSDAV